MGLSWATTSDSDEKRAEEAQHNATLPNASGVHNRSHSSRWFLYHADSTLQRGIDQSTRPAHYALPGLFVEDIPCRRIHLHSKSRDLSLLVLPDVFQS